MESLTQMTRNQLPIHIMLGAQAFAKTFRGATLVYGIKFRLRQANSKQFIHSDYSWQCERTFAWTNFYHRLNKD
ncbi:MAG: hypothetical protein NZ108_05820 [Bacteroidia bacterium]|nr:hypothetical protein [Bacteroidia bacterium]